MSIDKNMFYNRTSWNMTAEFRPLTDGGNLMTYLIEQNSKEQVELVNLFLTQESEKRGNAE